MATENNNVYNSSEKTHINPSHLKRADSGNGSGNILWSRDIDWGDISSNLGTLDSRFIIQKLEDISDSLSELSNRVTALDSKVTTLDDKVTVLDDRVTALENQTPEPELILTSAEGSIQRPKGSLSSIDAVGGSADITVTVGSTANITKPTSLTLTYESNINEITSTPVAIYNGSTVTPTWTSSDTSVATVSETTITAVGPGSATLTATYNGKTATYNLTVTDESTSSSVTSGWTYTSDDTNIATISDTTVTGKAQGTTRINVNYEDKTCKLTGTVTVNAAPQLSLSVTSGSIQRPKGSLSSIDAVGGSADITVTVDSTANITKPTSLTLTYGSNTNKTVSTPIATYNEETVIPTWRSNNTLVAEVNGSTITAVGPGSATLTATYNGQIATYNLTVTNESTSSSVTSGWTYTSDDTTIATISGTTVTGKAPGTTRINVNYSGKTYKLPGTVTVNAAAQDGVYFSIGTTEVTLDNYTTVNNATTEIPSSTIYQSTVRNYHYILTPANKTIAIVDTDDNAPINFTEQTDIVIPNHKVYKTNGPLNVGGRVTITLSDATPQAETFYFSIGITPIDETNYTTANNGTTEIPTSTIYQSTVRNYHYILTPANKTIAIVDTDDNAPINFTEQTDIVISNHKVYRTNGPLNVGGRVTITLS